MVTITKYNTKNDSKQYMETVKDILDSCKGTDAELKEDCVSKTGIGYRRFLRLYNGETKNITLTESAAIIAWANTRRVPGSLKFTLDQLISKTIVPL